MASVAEAEGRGPGHCRAWGGGAQPGSRGWVSWAQIWMAPSKLASRPRLQQRLWWPQEFVSSSLALVPLLFSYLLAAPTEKTINS